MSNMHIFTDAHGNLAVAQRPNPPLWVAIGAWAARALSTGDTLYTIADVAFVAALGVWSTLEITSGISLFRRLLGTVVLAWLVAARFW